MAKKATTTRVMIAEKHVKEAAALAAAGTLASDEQQIFSDERTQGLRLLVQKNSASWVVKYKNWSKTIGFIYPDGNRPLKTATAARELVPIIKGLLDEDEAQVEPFLVAKYAGRDNKAAIAEMRPVATTWTLKQCAEETIRARTALDSDDKLKPASVEEIERTMRRPEMASIIDVPASLIKRGQVEAIRDAVLKSSGVSPSKKLISNIRTVLTYCCIYQSGLSGLDDGNMWWELLKSDKRVKARTRRPEVDGIAKTMLIAQEYLHKPLPGRTDGKRGVRPNVYAGLWWLTLTAQRTSAAISLRKIDFYPDPVDPEYYLAAWDEDVMKSGKTHVLPIPRRAYDHMKPLIEAASDEHGSQWAFPSERGSEENDIHINRTAVRQFLVRLDGRDETSMKAWKAAEATGKKHGVPKPVSLLALAGVAFWAPHDLRRSITAVCDEAGVPAGASAILAHEIKLSVGLGEDALTDAQRETWLANRMAKITKLAYGGGAHHKLKKEAMAAWTDAVLDAYEALQVPEAVEMQAAA